MPMRAFVFDAYGTLFDVHAAIARHRAAAGPDADRFSEIWRTKQLEYAGRHLTAIEINATNYRLQKPEYFRRWGASVPDGFKFAIKASRFCTNRRVLGEAEEAIERFCTQGFTELGEKLGPILWQFMPTKQFDPDDFGAFLQLLRGNANIVQCRQYHPRWVFGPGSDEGAR